MFEVKENAYNLNCRKSFAVKHGKAAGKLLRKMMDEKQPRGMRLRIYDDCNSVTIQARNTEAIRIAENMLRRSGFKPRKAACGYVKFDMKEYMHGEY